MKKTEKHNIKRVIRFLENIEWMFELNNFERFLNDIETQPENDNLAAEVIPDMVYKSITVNLYPTFWKLCLERQRETLLHELVHSITQKSKMVAIGLLNGELHTPQEIKEINENMTSSITHYLNLLFIGKLKYAKIAYKDYLKK